MDSISGTSYYLTMLGLIVAIEQVAGDSVVFQQDNSATQPTAVADFLPS